MKNLALILNGVLAVAIAVLYYFHFSAQSASKMPESTVDMAKVDSISSFMRIAYVNTDTLWEQYEMIDVLQEELVDALATRFQVLGDIIAAYRDREARASRGKDTQLEDSALRFAIECGEKLILETRKQR